MTDRVETASPDELLGLSSDALSAMLRLRQSHPELSDELQPAIERTAELSGRLNNLSFEQVLIRVAEGLPIRQLVDQQTKGRKPSKFALLEHMELAVDANFRLLEVDWRQSNSVDTTQSALREKTVRLRSRAQYDVLVRYYGLGSKPPMSLAEIAAEAGTQAGTAKELLVSAMRNIGFVSRMGILQQRGPHFKFR